MKATRFNTPAIAKAEIRAAFDLNATAPAWDFDRACEIGQLVYSISGGFSHRRLARAWIPAAIGGALKDLARGDYDRETTTRACEWLNKVIVGYNGGWDLVADPYGIDITNPATNAAATAFFAETEVIHELTRGDLQSLTSFYLLYKQDWQDCQSLQNEYFTLTGKYYRDYPVM